MLVSGNTWTSAIPHEEGQHMTFRQLSWRELEQAAKVKRNAVLAEAKDMLAIMGDRMPTAPPSERATAINRDHYDMATLLLAGIKEWSYDAPITAEVIGTLDLVTANWAADEILQIKQERTPEEKKDG